MDTFKDRLLSFFDKDAKPSHIASEIGMSLPGFMRVYNDGFIPKADSLIKIQEVTGCNLNWLLIGIGEPYPSAPKPPERKDSDIALPNYAIYDTLGYEVDIDEFVFIPRYDVFASAGNGHFNGNEKPKHTMAFRRYWIENYLMADPADLFVITVRGDSMPGIVEDKDIILVNRAMKPGNGVFLIRIGEELIVKHVQTLPGSELLVKSTNDIYEPFIIDSSPKYNDINVLGGVMWLARTL